jgi:hypothetical protein
MVFYTTFKQLKYFDYFRPIDINILEGISNLHIYKEKIFIDNTTVSEVYDEIIRKMESRIFRFLVVQCVNYNGSIIDGYGNNSDINNNNDNDDNNNNGDDNSNKNGKNTCYIKLYKLSNIFQYLSVIEICITENENEKDNRNIINGKKLKKSKIVFEKKMKKNEKKNIVIFIRSSSVSVFPAFVPLGFLLSFLFYLIPYVDFGVNQKYVKDLKSFLNFNDEDDQEGMDICLYLYAYIYVCICILVYVDLHIYIF